ncbi:MAG: Hsp20/alpha crystallin family protein [Microbacterium sp.]|uniref:Hsp20/alpha crystallin family protein n=2 Tax=Microbacterium TaxID=33882 RepID=UPI001ACA347B|nr:Hsp20/alpha crystallin family protein [Microbacterium sp.]MBN9155639.1 Hsp20/alpha crystallin family protein [Microbacterium sp.]MBN9190022.1 Hsp20/alpha crystallin family protein [Microbacterium sp.]
MATYDPLRDLERFANSMFEPTRRGPREMPMDLYRDGDHYVLAADLPGIDPGSVDVDVDGQLLTIRAERTLPAGEGVKWITRERAAGSFLRQLSLGQGIDTENIAASYRHGVLSVTLPVSEKAKARKVEVRTSDDAPSLRVQEGEQSAVEA